MRRVLGGTFRMGADCCYPEEAPVHTVAVSGFWMDEYPVTNAEFAAFVAATDYRTVAERPLDPRLSRPPAGTVEARQCRVLHAGRLNMNDIRSRWTYVPGADWRHPDGPPGTIEGRGQEPAVHVVFEDAAAYAAYTAPMTSNEFGVAPSIINRSYRITDEMEVPEGGADGVLVTQGARFSGYGLYLKDGKPTFTMNLPDIERQKWQGTEALPPGKHTVVFDWKMDPQGMAVGRGGPGTLSVNGQQVAQPSLPLPSLSSGPGTRRSTSASTPGRRLTMPTITCHSPLPASWGKLPSISTKRA